MRRGVVELNRQRELELSPARREIESSNERSDCFERGLKRQTRGVTEHRPSSGRDIPIWLQAALLR